MDYRFLLPKAIEMAAKAHGNVMNKDGSPYILHPLRLMMKAEGYADKIVAVLHDTLEDTSLTAECLVDEGFSAEIIKAIEAVTKREGEDYEAFIERIALNALAVRVKLLDLYDNIDVTRLPELGEWELERTAKYHRAIKRLKQTLTAEPSATCY
ncbi:MAG: GTP pyrophosphokinase [Janthinobacterium lividum]